MEEKKEGGASPRWRCTLCEVRKPALMYCEECKESMCVSHLEDHKITTSQHPIVEIKKKGVILKNSNSKGVIEYVRELGNEVLHWLSDMAIDREGRLIVPDLSCHWINIFSQDGTLLHTFGANGKGDGKFDSPWGVTVDKEGRILVADSNNGRVQVFDSLPHKIFASFWRLFYEVPSLRNSCT